MGHDVKESDYDSVWNRAVFYDEPNSNTFKKFTFTGRLQGDYYNFDDSVRAQRVILTGDGFGSASRLLFLRASPCIRRRI